MAVSKNIILAFANRMISKTVKGNVATKNFNQERIRFDGVELNLVKVNVSKIKEMLNIIPEIGCAYRIMHGKESCYLYQNNLFDDNGVAILTFDKIGNSITAKVSLAVLQNEKSWFCFVIRKYLIPTTMYFYNMQTTSVDMQLNPKLQIVDVPKKVLIEFVEQLNAL